MGCSSTAPHNVGFQYFFWEAGENPVSRSALSSILLHSAAAVDVLRHGTSECHLRCCRPTAHHHQGLFSAVSASIVSNSFGSCGFRSRVSRLRPYTTLLRNYADARHYVAPHLFVLGGINGARI